MKKSLRTIIIVFVILIGTVALVGTGFAFGRSSWGMAGFHPNGMMGDYFQNSQNSQYAYGMDPSMMDGAGYGMMGPGMMGNYGVFDNVEPLSAEEAHKIVDSYLNSFGNEDLGIEEIMTFENNAYAIVIEESTGIGAFELLVDPVTKAVFPEYGPNMMWNLKYGMMSGFGGYGMMGPGMMMGNSGFGPGNMMGEFSFDNETNFQEISGEMPVAKEEALEVAQNFLDQYSPGVKVSDKITAFYGYYTIDLESDGEIVGMLSVNGFTRQVFPHTWHGKFIEMIH